MFSRWVVLSFGRMENSVLASGNAPYTTKQLITLSTISAAKVRIKLKNRKVERVKKLKS